MNIRVFDETVKKQISHSMKKAVKIIIYIVLPVILALLILVLIALPYGIKKYVNEHGAEYTGRKMSVQDIKINYFKATLNVIDFKLFEADGQHTFVSFDTLMVHIAPFPLLSSKFVAEQIRLVRPFVNLVRKDSLYNFDDMIAFVNSKPKAKADTLSKPSAPFEYVLNKISLEQGKLTFTDKGVDYTTTLSDLNFLVPSISDHQFPAYGFERFLKTLCWLSHPAWKHVLQGQNGDQVQTAHEREQTDRSQCEIGEKERRIDEPAIEAGAIPPEGHSRGHYS